VTQLMMNSNVQLSLSQCHGETELMVSLYGPSDLRGFKQDPAKAVIELTIKDLTSKEVQVGDGVNLENIRSEVRSMLEQVIQLSAYPRCVLTFQVFITKREAPAQLFSACANGLLAALNQAGIHMKTAPCAALTLGVKLNDMSDDESMNLEILETPRTYPSPSDQTTMLDLVVSLPQTVDLLYFKSHLPFDFTSSILGNEKSIKALEEIMQRRG